MHSAPSDVKITAALTASYPPQLMRAGAILRMGANGLAAFLHETAGINPCLRFHAPAAMIVPNFAGNDDDFRDKLHQRLSDSPPPPGCRQAAAIAIDRLDDNGLIEWDDLQQAAADSDIDAETAAAALAHLQTLGPPGIAARDLKECLMLQLAAVEAGKTPIKPPLPAVMDSAKDIVQNRLRWFLRRRFDKLPRRHGRAAIVLLESLSFCPADVLAAAGDSAEPADSLADIEFYETRGLWKVRAGNGDCRPRAAPDFGDDTESRSGQEAANSRRQAYYQARQIASAVSARRRQLFKLAQCAADRQAAFLTSANPADLLPFPMQTAAAELMVTPGMVSHIAANKYFLLSGRIYALKLLFAQPAPGGIAAAAAQRCIEDLIAHEDPVHPCSDALLQRLLRQRGISLARRTIGKYRTASGIVRASLRKRAGGSPSGK